VPRQQWLNAIAAYNERFQTTAPPPPRPLPHSASRCLRHRVPSRKCLSMSPTPRPFPTVPPVVSETASRHVLLGAASVLVRCWAIEATGLTFRRLGAAARHQREERKRAWQRARVGHKLPVVNTVSRRWSRPHTSMIRLVSSAMLGQTDLEMVTPVQTVQSPCLVRTVFSQFSSVISVSSGRRAPRLRGLRATSRRASVVWAPCVIFEN
jgi:hypothetical protein